MSSSSSSKNNNSSNDNNNNHHPNDSNKKLKLSSNDNNNKNMNNDVNNKNNNNNNDGNKLKVMAAAGKIEELKAREVALSRLLAAVRREKLEVLRAKPLKIGIVGFGRFGQFIAQTFAKHGTVVATSRSDYTQLANDMGVLYIPLSKMDQFLQQNLDVIVLATSIVSFDDTVQHTLLPHLQTYLDTHKDTQMTGPLIVDVLSVKEHPREVMIQSLPPQCDILCTHPMFGPDSGKHGWHGLTFVYERTRIGGITLHNPTTTKTTTTIDTNNDNNNAVLVSMSDDEDEEIKDDNGMYHSIHENNEAYIEGKDRMERFLSIWEEEGCRMIQLSCKDHDAYAANSQFITHLMGRILGQQGLAATPIDTKGFESVLKLIDSTTADSFDLFYGLYKYNTNSMDIILKLQQSMTDVVHKLKEQEQQDR